jgi:hypothetical protein
LSKAAKKKRNSSADEGLQVNLYPSIISSLVQTEDEQEVTGRKSSQRSEATKRQGRTKNKNLKKEGIAQRLETGVLSFL